MTLKRREIQVEGTLWRGGLADGSRVGREEIATGGTGRGSAMSWSSMGEESETEVGWKGAAEAERLDWNKREL